MKLILEKLDQKICVLPLLLFFLFSCSNAPKKNQYLGGIPAIEKKYHGMITELIELAPGTQWELFAYYQTEAIIELENLAKLKIIGLEGK